MAVRKRGRSWQVDFYWTDRSGRRRRVQRAAPPHVTTRRRAERFELELLDELRSGAVLGKEDPKPREVPTLRSFADTFIADYAIPNNRPSTVREKRGRLKAIVPVLGRLRLDAIRPQQLEQYKAARLREGRSPKTVNEELALIGKMLRVAHEWDLLGAVPKIRRLKVPPPDFDFLDFDEAARLIQASSAELDPWGAMIVTALRTGLRQGELRGLRWDDCDLVAGRLVVRVAADARNELHPPKNGKHREVPLGDEVLEVLAAHRHLRGTQVFCNVDGSMLSQRQVERPLHRLCRRAGLRRIGWHALRHTFASHLVMRGVPLRTVQELLGHGSIAMTLRYSHLTPDARRDAVRLLDAPAAEPTAAVAGGDEMVTPLAPRRKRPARGA